MLHNMFLFFFIPMRLRDYEVEGIINVYDCVGRNKNSIVFRFKRIHLLFNTGIFLKVHLHI